MSNSLLTDEQWQQYWNRMFRRYQFVFNERGQINLVPKVCISCGSATQPCCGH